MRLTVLAGGVGGARFLDGMRRVASPETITVVGNVGDDLEILGLSVSPDLDTILYTLSGLVEPGRGWGRAGDTANALAVVRELGGEAWFHLGDLDIGLHLVRTERLRAGEPLSAITGDFARRLGIGVALLPATDDRLRTIVSTPAGDLDFQTYFVRRRHEDEVLGVRFDGAPGARPAPGVREAIAAADVAIVAPSNPYLSVDPILAVDGVRDALAARHGPTVAVSPIVGGKAVKGPADRLLRSLAGEATPAALARHYDGLLTHLVLDEMDRDHARAVEALGVRTLAAATLMRDGPSRARLAETVLALARSA